jgi:hypothetical protein
MAYGRKSANSRRLNREAELNQVIGRLGYVAPMAEVPVNHPISENGNLTWDWRDVLIRDARKIPGGASLERNGFATVPHHCGITRWEGDAWKDQWVREALDLVKQVTGASKTMVTRLAGRSDFPFGLRSSRFEPHDAPVAFIHNDFTPGSGPRHLAADYPALVPAAYAKRFAIYNVWHLISAPPQSDPLAVCDPTSIAVWDMVPGEARYGSKEDSGLFGENTMLRYNPKHCWYYYPDLRNDETLIWCGYDSDTTRVSIVPHAAFRDPSCQRPGAERTCVHGTVYAFFE